MWNDKGNLKGKTYFTPELANLIESAGNGGNPACYTLRQTAGAHALSAQAVPIRWLESIQLYTLLICLLPLCLVAILTVQFVHLSGRNFRAKRDFLYSAVVSAANCPFSLRFSALKPDGQWPPGLMPNNKKLLGRTHFKGYWDGKQFQQSWLRGKAIREDGMTVFCMKESCNKEKKSVALFPPSVTTWLQRSFSPEWTAEGASNMDLQMSGKSLWQYLLLHSWGQDTKSEHGKHAQEQLNTSTAKVILKENNFSALCLLTVAWI